MNGEIRRKSIIDHLEESKLPISGEKLAEIFNVSRQVIVQDIALLRAGEYKIVSTSRGYLLDRKTGMRRILKLRHSDEQIEEELNMIVDYGGRLIDVFVYHKIYGLIKVDLFIKSRLDVQKYIDEISSGKSFPLKNVTSGYHYHTIVADDEKSLDLIQKKLEEAGFLAELKSYEPVEFSR
ncbi:MAG: transcription repressor NadR [Clostridia bacterium]|nr:transcription repressor NadR [Clostridia bacterium]